MTEPLHHKVIHGPSMPPPMGHYSQAVQVGNLLFIAGQPGIDLSGSADPDTARAVPGGFEAEWRQAFRNLGAILDDAGSGLRHELALSNWQINPTFAADTFATTVPAGAKLVPMIPRATKPAASKP